MTMIGISGAYLPAIIYKSEIPVYNIDIARRIICFTIGCIIEYLYSNNLLTAKKPREGGYLLLYLYKFLCCPKPFTY